MIQLSPLAESHMPAVLRIQDTCYVEIEPESRASLQAKVLASPETCFVAETRDGVVGYLIAAPILYPELPALDAPAFAVSPAADTLYIHDLAVTDAGRGTGAGRALVQSAMQAASGRRLRNACLVAIQGSARYWERFGFQAVAAPAAGIADKLASYGHAAQLMRATL